MAWHCSGQVEAGGSFCCCLLVHTDGSVTGYACCAAVAGAVTSAGWWADVVSQLHGGPCCGIDVKSCTRSGGNPLAPSCTVLTLRSLA